MERLRHEDLGAEVLVEEFSYGAVAVAQRLQELAPDALILVGAVARGREPGSVERREIVPLPRPPSEVQRWIADAVTGFIDIDLVLEVAHGLGALPARTVTIEVEPATTEPSTTLSPSGEAGLARALELTRAELRR